MNRRTFNKLAGLATMGALTADLELNAQQAAAIAGEIVLEDSDFLVAFDRASGALTRMEYKPTQWTVERRPALGASFRMLAHCRDAATTLCLAKSKRLRGRKTSDNQVGLRWKDLVSEHGGSAAHHLYGDRDLDERQADLRRHARKQLA